MHNKICILGRQPELSLAELESILGPANMQPVNDQVVIVNDSLDLLVQDNLGGTVKIAKLVKELSTTDVVNIADELKDWVGAYASSLEEGKFNFGISCYGLALSSHRLQALGLDLKKYIRPIYPSVRLVTATKGIELSSAQIIHNDLTKGHNRELVVVGGKEKTFLGWTVAVQDIESYSTRDFGRPRRDMVVGMLPPKLAQIMLNLAEAGQGSLVLDPFCGTGVVLMEASLRDSTLQGSDLNPKMIEYTKANLEWLSSHGGDINTSAKLATADAKTHTWKQPVGHVVTEVYLGPPLANTPDRAKLDKIVEDCNGLLREFLVNLLPQLTEGVRCTIAVPAWKTQQDFRHLPLIDHLGEIGYNQHSFSYADNRGLLYFRNDQVVARELLVISRK
ncbi:MAG TPA: hypothetical protein VGS28_04450 [Candidatus Saccharimonadales bacterium]|nr:hypothetical protein [Candidatus Saccharimonadales bacterium]